MLDPENKLLRRRIEEVGAKIANARIKGDELKASPRSPTRDAALQANERELTILQQMLKSLVTELSAS